MKRLFLALIISCFALQSEAQVKLCLDSTLKAAYIKRYGFYDGLMCLPFHCDPFCVPGYGKNDTVGLCGRFVFVDTGFKVKVRPGFELPCAFEPRFSEGLCAVGKNGKLVFIDTFGKVVLNTNLSACNSEKNRVKGFVNGKCKVYKGSGGLRNVYDVYYIDRQGKRIRPLVSVRVRLKPVVPIAVNEKPRDKDTTRTTTFAVKAPLFEVPRQLPRGKYPVTEEQAKSILSTHSHKDNRMLLFFDCGQYQLENMSESDTSYCGKFVFTDSNFNVKISSGFSLPCGFEPEFSEGLCAVANNGYIVYIDTNGTIKLNTGLKACDTVMNKASTFRYGIATLYIGDTKVKGNYTTIAINVNGERVRLLEFDELDLAENKLSMFKNLTIEECSNCFIGKGKSNGLWFLVEKSGKVKKKLELR